MTRVNEVTRAELEARRREILAELGVTHEDLARRARDSALVADEWHAWDKLREIEFLLADER